MEKKYVERFSDVDEQDNLANLYVNYDGLDINLEAFHDNRDDYCEERAADECDGTYENFFDIYGRLYEEENGEPWDPAADK